MKADVRKRLGIAFQREVQVRFPDRARGTAAQEGALFRDEVEHQSHLWEQTSGGNEAPAVQMQKAVQEEFDLGSAPMTHMGDSDAPNDIQRAYVRAEYNQTQRFLKEQGLDSVSVYRGVHDLPLTAGAQTVDMQPASSWTTDLDRAMQFGYDMSFRLPVRATVLTTRVPRARVLSTAVTGRGAVNEGEVILLGGPLDVTAYPLSAGEERDAAFAQWAARIRADER